MEPKKEDFPLRQENLHLSLLENDNYLQAVLTIITIFQLLLAKRPEVSFGNLGKFRYSIFFFKSCPSHQISTNCAPHLRASPGNAQE
jgi:hypothetical protein